MKKAQLTIIIITGILLLFALGFVIWLGTRTASLKTGTEAEQQRLRQVAVQPVQEFIQRCLDVTTSTLLGLLGRQGGVLYKSQGGLTQDVLPQEEGSRFVLYENTNVSYLILPPEGDIPGLFFSSPPDYPFRTFPYVFRANEPNTGEIVQFQDAGYYGISRLQPLLKPGSNSLQEQLESAIAYQLPKCTNWSVLSAQGVEVSAGAVNASVFIAENLSQIEAEKFFTAHIKWPVTIKDLTTDGTTLLEEFSLSYPVHFAKFYLFIKNLIDRDVGNASFDPHNASTQFTPVRVIKNVFVREDGSTDDLVIVQDSEAQLKDKPLEFWILRKNRIPALVWINSTDLEDYKFIPTGLCNIDSDNIFLSGNDLLIKWGSPDDWRTKLKAMDPDEDAVTFRTEPPAPAKINVQYSGQEFLLYVYASDGGEAEDSQTLKLRTDDCPRK
jgi:hypothetical protein